MPNGNNENALRWTPMLVNAGVILVAATGAFFAVRSQVSAHDAAIAELHKTKLDQVVFNTYIRERGNSVDTQVRDIKSDVGEINTKLSDIQKDIQDILKGMK